MGELSTYSTLEEKAKVFSVENVENKTQVNNLLNEVAIKKDCIWRGVTDAKFKLYTSLQRFWIANDMPTEFNEVQSYLNTLRDEASKWNNRFFDRYIEHIRGEKRPTQFSLLGILRHHGAPVPYMDWTRNPLVALFFMTAGETTESNDPIDNYCSLFMISRDHQFSQTNSKNLAYKQEEMNLLEQLIIEGKIKIEDFSNHIGLSPDEFNDKDLVRKIMSEQAFGKLADSSGGIITYLIEDQIGDEFEWGINNNMNIVSQEGLFIFNTHPSEPLENIIPMQMNFFAQKDGLTSKISPEQRTFQTQNIYKNIKCYNFHKRLSPYIRNKLSKLNITHNYLFPDLNEMANYAVSSYLE